MSSSAIAIVFLKGCKSAPSTPVYGNFQEVSFPQTIERFEADALRYFEVKAMCLQWHRSGGRFGLVRPCRYGVIYRFCNFAFFRGGWSSGGAREREHLYLLQFWLEPEYCRGLL
jgi:hypothetical protein